MNRDDKFKINFNDLADGWMTVELKAGQQQYYFFPSHVPYDSIRELADGLGNLLSGYLQATARWNDEPAEHEFVFEKTGEVVDFKVYFLNETLLGRVREEVFSITGLAYVIIRPFWKALRDLETRYSYDEYHRRWREPFPIREMNHFTKQFEKLKKTFV